MTIDYSNRKTYFEIMRIIACALVIFNHSAAYCFYQTSNGLKQFIYMCITMITRINVPLFFMISGALLLGRNESIQFVIKKRVLRIVCAILIFDIGNFLIRKIAAIYRGREYTYTLFVVFRNALSNDLDGTGAYWFLFAYLGFLFMLPFLQRAAKEMTRGDFIVLIVMHCIVSSVLPMLNLLFAYNGIDGINICRDFNVPFAFEKAFFYPLIGYYLEHNINVTHLKQKQILGILIVGAVGILLSNICTYGEGVLNGSYTQNYVQLFDYVTAIVAYIVIKYMVINNNELLNGSYPKHDFM